MAVVFASKQGVRLVNMMDAILFCCNNVGFTPSIWLHAKYLASEDVDSCLRQTIDWVTRHGSGCGDLKANREGLLCPNLGKWSYSACFVFRGALKKPHKALALRGFFFLAAYTRLLGLQKTRTVSSLSDIGLARVSATANTFCSRLSRL